jgi:hypothetical protein
MPSHNYDVLLLRPQEITDVIDIPGASIAHRALCCTALEPGLVPTQHHERAGMGPGITHVGRVDSVGALVVRRTPMAGAGVSVALLIFRWAGFSPVVRQTPIKKQSENLPQTTRSPPRGPASGNVSTCSERSRWLGAEGATGAHPRRGPLDADSWAPEQPLIRRGATLRADSIRPRY